MFFASHLMYRNIIYVLWQSGLLIYLKTIWVDTLNCNPFEYCRREQLWATLDPLLISENDAAPAVTTPYTAAILEYRVVIHEKDVEFHEESYKAKMNGHAIHDVTHPCKYVTFFSG